MIVKGLRYDGLNLLGSGRSMQLGERQLRVHEGPKASMALLWNEFRADLMRMDRSSDMNYAYKVHVWNYPEGVMAHFHRTFGNDAETVGTLNTGLANWFQLYSPTAVPDKVEHRVWGNGSPNIAGGVDLFFHEERKAMECYARFASLHPSEALHRLDFTVPAGAQKADLHAEVLKKGVWYSFPSVESMEPDENTDSLQQIARKSRSNGPTERARLST